MHAQQKNYQTQAELVFSSETDRQKKKTSKRNESEEILALLTGYQLNSVVSHYPWDTPTVLNIKIYNLSVNSNSLTYRAPFLMYCQCVILLIPINSRSVSETKSFIWGIKWGYVMHIHRDWASMSTLQAKICHHSLDVCTVYCFYWLLSKTHCLPCSTKVDLLLRSWHQLEEEGFLKTLNFLHMLLSKTSL